VVSMVSGVCLLWLQRMQPLFGTLALSSLLYEIWLVKLRPSALRKRSTKAMLAVSLAVNVTITGGWILISVRYL
jgi:hypothetical protein